MLFGSVFVWLWCSSGQVTVVSGLPMCSLFVVFVLLACFILTCFCVCVARVFSVQTCVVLVLLVCFRSICLLYLCCQCVFY